MENSRRVRGTGKGLFLVADYELGGGGGWGWGGGVSNYLTKTPSGDL